MHPRWGRHRDSKGLSRGMPVAIKPMLLAVEEAIAAAEGRGHRVEIHLGVSGAELSCSSHGAPADAHNPRTRAAT